MSMTTKDAIAIADAAYEALDYQSLGRVKWRESCEEIEKRFADNLHKANPTFVPELIWRKAWSDGSSEGYHSVGYQYEELADIVQVSEHAAQQNV